MKWLFIVCIATVFSYHAAGQDASARREPDEAEINLDPRIPVGTLDAPDLDEISGCVASSINKDVLWVHNDSGDDANLYAISTNGDVLCVIHIDGAVNRDWEDIAIGPGPESGKSYIYVGDIGDNAGKSSTIDIYRVKEPSLDPICKEMTLSADKIELKYPDGPRDAEALIVDPITNDLYIITKRERKSRVYRLQAPFNVKKLNTLAFVCELPFSLATAGDISASGNSVIVKNYVYVYSWARKGKESLSGLFKRKPTTLPYMPEPQGEAICFGANGDGYYTLSERPDTTIDYPINYYYLNDNPLRYASNKHVKFYMTLQPSLDTKGIYLARYNVPVAANIRISVRNAIMMEVENVEPSTLEQGIMEREIDMIDKPDGTYVVVLCADRQYSASVFEVKH